MMDKPQVQFAIKMLDFIVTNVSMNLDHTLQKSVDGELRTEIQLDMGYNEKSPNHYTVKFIVKLLNEEEKFSFDMVAFAIFETKENITEEFMNSAFAKVNSPAIAFPYVRSFITTITSNAGIPPIILPSYNFTKVAK